MMEVRLLEANEYGLLDQIQGEDHAEPSPDNSIVAVAIEDGKIKGRLVLLNVPHLEAIWIDPEERGRAILARMEAVLLGKLKELGAKQVIGFAVNEKMESYLERRGYSKLATAWIKEIK
jgi:N-acetylglutamate synthase-like GNAT family acetyltransferase